jgi:hypothetical protein
MPTDLFNMGAKEKKSQFALGENMSPRDLTLEIIKD